METSLTGLLEVPVARMNGSLLAAADPSALPYATAIGAAVGHARSGTERINLIPASRAERKVAARRRIQLGAGIVIAAAAVVLIALGITRSLAEQAQQRAKDKTANDELAAAQTVVARTRTEHDQLATTYKTVAAGLSRDHPAVDVLKAVSDAIPATSGIHLNQLAVDRAGAVTVRGNATSETAATDLVLALQGSHAFSEVRLTYLGDAQAEAGAATAASPAGVAARAKPGENMSFIIACRLKGVAPPALPGAARANRPAGGQSAGASRP